MPRVLPLLFALIFSAFTSAITRAFVVNRDAAGAPVLWPLTNPHPQVSTNTLNPATQSIRIFFGAQGYSVTNAAAELNSVRAALAQWESVPGTRIRFEEGGLIPSGADVDPADNTNLIYWARTSTFVYGGRDNIAGALALRYPRIVDGNVLAEADIVFNGVDFRWTPSYTNTVPGIYFIEAVALHEVGHLLGLDHSPLGGATMFARSLPGLNSEAGLSEDEAAAARSLYPAAPIAWGTLSGVVRMNGNPVFGAVVVAEDAASNPVTGTVSLQNGEYELGGLLPGEYRIKATPLDPFDPRVSHTRLVSGYDIAPAYGAAQTFFLSTTNRLQPIAAGQTNRLDWDVPAGTPPLRITRIKLPTIDPSRHDAVNAPVSLRPGDQNVYLGVFSPESFGFDSTFMITGPGVRLGEIRVQPNVFPGLNPPLNVIYAPVSVDSTAEPGLRSFAVQKGGTTAYAHGFLEIADPAPDFNFDLLDDLFQRAFFPLFTSRDAAPAADPDQDGANNLSEYGAGTNPMDSQSVLRIESIAVRDGRVTIRCSSIPGRRYALLAKKNLPNGNWSMVTGPVVAGGAALVFEDTILFAAARYYVVQAVR